MSSATASGTPTPLYLQDPDVTLYHGHVFEVLPKLADASVDCVVTSPPYWGLRDYGTPGQIGLEPTPEKYTTNLVVIFREVRRVLAPHGTVWLNLGDSYAGGAGGRGDSGRDIPRSGQGGQAGTKHDGQRLPRELSGLKPKDLVGIPWRVAFALQADGWYLRSDIIWAKPNPMPESVTDRPTKAHEYVFLLSKQPKYFFDQEAVRERWTGEAELRLPHERQRTRRTLDNSTAARGPDGRRKTMVQGANGSIQHRDGERWPNGGRNIRSVWEIATQPYPEAHFATFPEELARRAVAAGCPEGGTVLDPFVGSGTVCFVARKLGRHSIGIDLNAEYLELAARRLQQQSLFVGAEQPPAAERTS